MRQRIKSPANRVALLDPGVITFLFFIAASCSVENTTTDQHDHHSQHDEKVKVTDLMLTDSQMALANIHTQAIQVKTMGEPRVLNARLVQNSDLSEVFSSRASGRIDRLFVKETGRTVKQGEPLYEIYSEELLTLQQEFLVAHNQALALGEKKPRYKSFEDAAKKKLILYGLTENQIIGLSKSGKISSRITFLAPASGIVKSIDTQEGQYIAKGSAIYRIENFNTLWVEAELFASEGDLVKSGDRIKVQIDQLPVIEANVEFINPEFKDATQTWVLRASIPNRGNLNPGMAAQVWIDRSKTGALTLPVQAVIRSEAGTHVYVEIDKNTFRPRKVKTGVESFSEVEILDGLMVGETVAISGAYLIYSEYILKHGVNPITSID